MTVASAGSVAVLFTDVVGSTRLWAEHYEEMSDDLARHDAVVRACIDMHGGRVFAQSDGEGKGATFTLELPRSHSLPEAATPAS